MAGLKNNYQFEFTDTLATSGTSVRISNEKENGAVATFTDQYITVRSDDNSIVERMKGSAAAGTLTLTMRGLDQSDTDTQVPGLKRERREGSKAFVTYVASQHVDAKGENIFSGTQTFENITVTNNSTLTNATVSGKYKGPSVDDVAERNSMYPTPVDGNMVQVETIGLQYYKTSAGGWVTLDEGTPTPDATEAVKGKARIATTAEVTAGTDDTTIVTPKKLKEQVPEALYEKDTYIAGETILENDSLFIESLPTFAESTVVQNIGDVTANTRVSILGFGSGVASNTLKLSLRKFVSPSANLSVRIETVSGGNPTGTLVDANATATVTAASITTSLVDTTITLAGSITITKGQQVAIVLSQVGDVVNATNYYGVGYVARDTNTRNKTRYNGTNWANGQLGSDITDNSHQPNQTLTGSEAIGYKIEAIVNMYIKSINKSPSNTATRLVMRDGITKAILNTYTFSGNTVTFPTALYISQGTTIYFETDNNGTSYTYTRSFTVSFPLVGTRVRYLSSSSNGQDTFTLASGLNQNQSYNIDSIITQLFVFDTIAFPYISSTLFENRVLSETNASFSYKLPTDYPRIATQGYSIGQIVTSKYFGLHTYPGLVANTAYYVANTPGQISAVAGSNPYVLGKTDGNGTLKINGKVLNKSITVSASPFSYTNTTGGPIQVSITGGTVNPIVINGVTTATATGHINTLPAGGVMTVTYTVLPTITYSDL